ncbi:aspartyl protease family protein [Flavobacterium sp.]|uniref:aspartyl protease family protein n=1 Tax=Flavobacterium sp. TaxID=239 RepID=UPI003752D65B
MQRKITLIFVMLQLTLINCLAQNGKQISKNGYVKQKDYFVEIPFNYINKHIFIEVIISDKKNNFLFDTGYEISAIDKDISKEINYTLKKEIELSGSSVSTQKVGLIELPNISISNVSFEKTYGMLQDLSFIKRNYETIKISGIIGNNLMRKSKWQIDYLKKVIHITNKTDNFAGLQNAKKIELNNKDWGLGYVNIELNNQTHKFIFDLGSSGEFTANLSFVKFLKEKDTLIQQDKQTFRVGKIKIGEIEINNKSITLEKYVSSLLGNAFFENYLLTIDWEKNILFLNQNTN